MVKSRNHILKDKQYYKFSFYGFLKNLRFFEPFLILFLLQKGFTYLEIGSLYAIREISLNLFEIPSGIIADTLGRKLTLASTFLIYILSFLVFSFGDGFLLFSIAMAVFALGDAARSGVNKAMIMRYLEQTNQTHLKVDYYGHTRSWSQYGSALSSLLAAVLVFYTNDLNGIFLFSIVPYTIDFFLVLSYKSNLDDHSKLKQPIRQKIGELFKTFKVALSNIKLLKTISSTAIYSGLYKSLKDFIQPFLKASLASIPILMFLSNEQKLSALIGITYFLIFIASAIASRNSSIIKDWVGGQRKLLNISLIVGAGLGLLSGVMMTTLVLPIIVIPLFILLLIIENLRKPAAVSEVTGQVDDIGRTSILSIVSQLTSLLAAIFVLTIGYLADTYSLGLGISAVSVILLITLPFTFLKSAKV